MTVRVKFKCTGINRSQGWGEFAEIQQITLVPVVQDSAENKAFFAATPSGQIVLGCANAEAAKQFDLGKEFYVDFTPA